MRRREFITLLGGGAALWPLTARAQQVRHIAILSSARVEPSEGAFRKRLDALGWHEGSNLGIAIRLANGGIDQARNYASELVAMKPDVFFANNTQMVKLIQAKTDSIPIIFIQVPDPIGSGFVESFAHPGGNITGFTNFDPSMGGKWLEFLKDVAPNLKRIAVILEAGNPTAPGYLKTISAAASALALQISPLTVPDGPSLDEAIETFAREPDGGLVVPPSALTAIFRARIIALAARYHVPAMYPYSEYATSGGLISYGVNRTIPYEQAASYVDRILKGEKAGELPVQTPTRFEMVINLKTAKALGLTISNNFLSLADEVIE